MKISKPNISVASIFIAISSVFFISGCQTTDNAKTDQQIAYVGTYLPNGHGVYLMSVDPKDKQLNVEKIVSALPNPAQMVADKEGKYLYVASEVNDYNYLNHGSITAYAIEPETGELNFLNQVSSQGGSPVYLSIHPSGDYLFVANYTNGVVSSYKIKENGYLTTRINVYKSGAKPKKPNVSPEAAVKGSFANSGHGSSHAHMIQSSPDGNYLFSTDLGLDRIYQWKFNNGKFTPNKPNYISASSIGAGPRHFVFHATNNFVYLVNEESSTVTVYHYDPESGTLDERQSLSSLPENYVGTSYASGVIISSDGKYLYVANRLHNSIAIFQVNSDGTLTWKDAVWSQGDYPRTITFDLSGRYLYVANQKSDNIAQFSVKRNGMLGFTGNITAVGSPSQIIFVPLVKEKTVDNKTSKK